MYIKEEYNLKVVPFKIFKKYQRVVNIIQVADVFTYLNFHKKSCRETYPRRLGSPLQKIGIQQKSFLNYYLF